MKKILLITLCFLSLPFKFISQDDFLNNDSIPFEEFRNYLGSNISPLLMGVISGKDNFNVKVNLSYKRNFRDKNLRFSLNYLTEGNVLLYDYFIPVSTSDSTLTNRYFDNSFDYYDFRFGFEELRGYNGARVHVGADAIFGFGSNNSTYFDRKFNHIDSTGNYMLDTMRNNLSLYTGSHNVNYLVTGIDVSFGVDWMLNENFMFTFQLTPQFNYYIFLDENTIDSQGEYIKAKNYADFRLGYFDLILYYRF